jgi:CubicO group peptidase (beta-lactamase class C family)
MPGRRSPWGGGRRRMERWSSACAASPLGWVIERASGRSLASHVDEIVAEAGLEATFHISADCEGVPVLSGGGMMTARDLARYGLLIARRCLPAGCDERCGNALRRLTDIAIQEPPDEQWHTGGSPRLCRAVPDGRSGDAGFGGLLQRAGNWEPSMASAMAISPK